ncbi:E3 ubiquitin-protein ligase UBR4-like isoform X2 [Sycon ciliatum]|uniref:E3 ubiquitin-protein ligase UBR4-like isoform X2 n=1 Tax=Sycon ciliatum TaxID=27933 RepID=UPI0031F62BE6
MSATDWLRCKELLVGKEVSPSRVAVVCEEVAKCVGIPIPEIVKADPASHLVLALLGHHLVETGGDLENAQYAVAAAEIVLGVLLSQIVADTRDQLTKHQLVRIIAGLCAGHENGDPCLPPGELMAVNAVLHLSGGAKRVSPSDVPYSQLKARKTSASAADDSTSDTKTDEEDDGSFDDDEEDDEEEDDSSSAEDVSKEVSSEGKKPAESRDASASPVEKVSSDDNLDHRTMSDLAAFLLDNTGVDKPESPSVDYPPPLPAKPFDLRAECVNVLRKLNGVPQLLETALASASLAKCISAPHDLSPTLISSSVSDALFLQTGLTLAGLVPLTDASGKLLKGCADFVLRCFDSLVAHQHALHCKSSSDAAEEGDRPPSTFDGSKLARLLGHLNQVFKTLSSSLEKRSKDMPSGQDLNLQLSIQLACGLVSTASHVAICKHAVEDPFRCVAACKFAINVADTQIKVITNSWNKWINSTMLKLALSGESDGNSSSERVNAGVAALIEGRLLHSLVSVITVNCLKATRITSLLITASGPPTASFGRPRSSALLRRSKSVGDSGSKARSEGIASFFKTVSPPLPARAAAAAPDMTSSSDDEEKLFLDELMMTMPDEDLPSSAKESIPPVQTAKDVVTEVLDVAGQGLSLLRTILMCNNASVTAAIKQNLAAWQVLSLGELLSEMEIIGMLSGKEVTIVHEHLLPQFSSFVSRLLGITQALLRQQHLAENQQVALLASLGFSLLENGSWALRCSTQRVSVMAHVLVFDQERGGTLANRALHRFVEALSRELSDSSPAPLGATDVGVAHFQLMLTLLNGLPLATRQQILKDLVRILVDCSKRQDLCQRPPLILMRVLQFVEYLLYHFAYMPKDLAEKVKHNLFRTSDFSTLKHYPSADFSHVAFENDKSIDPGGAQPHLRLLIDMVPRFYGLRPEGPRSQTESSAQAVAFLRSLCDEGYSYGDFYRSLVSLLAAGSLCGVSVDDDQQPSYQNQVPLAATSVRSAVRYTWSMLCTLPIPCSALANAANMTSLDVAGITPDSALSLQAMLYLTKVIFSSFVAIQLRALTSDEKQEKFSALAQESSGMHADMDICLSIVVMAQEEVASGQKGTALAFAGFEGCLKLLGELDSESVPAPLLLLALGISTWQTRYGIDSWIDHVQAETDSSLADAEQSAVDTLCQKSIILATRALPVATAHARKFIVQSAKCCSANQLPPPLPRGRGGNSESGATRTGTASSSQQQARTAGTASSSTTASAGGGAAAAALPSTPTNPLPSGGADTVERGKLSHIIAHARNLTGALSGMASALEALSTSPATSSAAMDILDELDSFRASITGSGGGAPQQADDSSPKVREEPQAQTPAAPVPPCSDELLAAYDQVLQLGIVSTKGQFVSYPLVLATPNWLQASLSNWKGMSMSKYPATADAEGGDELKSLNEYVAAHLSSMTGASQRFDVCAAVRHTIQGLLDFCSSIRNFVEDGESIRSLLINSVVPCLLDATCQPLATCFALLEGVLGSSTSAEFRDHVCQYTVSMYFDLIMRQKTATSCLPEKLSSALFAVPVSMLESDEIRFIETHFSGEGDLLDLLMLSSLAHIDGSFTCRLLSFFTKYCAQKAKAKPVSQLTTQLSRLPELKETDLVSWIRRLIISLQTDDFHSPRDAFLDLILELIASSAVNDSSYLAILKALIPIGTELLNSNLNISFSLFVHCASSLADACKENGHILLCTAAAEWLSIGEAVLLNEMKDVDGEDDVVILSHPMLDSVTQLMRYLSNLSAAIKVASGKYQSDTTSDAEPGLQDIDGDWADDIPEDDESDVESEDESLNKLCTFTTTQREYSKQHWYHCFTCNFVGHIGICVTCARVCHKDHDTVYAKYGSFFCDCGAKQDGCKALSKRSNDNADGDSTRSAFDTGDAVTGGPQQESSTRSASRTVAQRSAPSQTAASHAPGAPTPRILTMVESIEGCKKQLIKLMDEHNTPQTVLHLVQTLLPRCVAQGQSILSQHGRSLACKAVEQLHNSPKATNTSESLVIGTAGSTEGLFDNVRVQVNGEQGNVIRQLLSSCTIKRSAMCAVVSLRNKKQHVAVNPDKGKITILQVSGLLRQFDNQRRKTPASGESGSQTESKRRKVTTRMTSTSVPFTVLSLTSNPVNDEYVAVCGHRDLHVLAFAPSSPGTVQQHISLHPAVEGNNCIIKALWIPGSQTQLAVITSDFIKIWDLGVDVLSPIYNFMLPSGKIIDATVSVVPQTRSSPAQQLFAVMSSSGFVYMQPIEDACRATFGPFYMTNALTIESADLPLGSGNIAGGGVSIYYSHCLQLLFLSFQNGKTFAARLEKDHLSVAKWFQIPQKSGRSTIPALYQWLEVAGHPGLVCALTVSNNTPIVIMVEPEKIVLCETKQLASKSKVQGIIGIRHNASGNEYRTALIVLCEDGALRLFGVDPGPTEFWTQPAFHVASPLASLSPARHQKPTKSGKSFASSAQPVDYLENLTVMNDVEFGGNDILQVYSPQQAKQRLTVASQYLASTKSSGFTIDVTNTNSSMVMCGCRLQLGGQYSSDRSTPTYATVLDKTITTTPGARLRWYDILFSREDAVQAQKKFTVTIGPSTDPNGITMVHSIRVFGKSKDYLSWMDDVEDTSGGAGSLAPNDGDLIGEQQHQNALSSTPSCVPITTASRFLASSLEVLESYFATVQSLGAQENMLGVALTTATSLLVAPMPPPVTAQTHCLLAALHPTRQAFHVHKDQAQLAHVARCLQSIAKRDASNDAVVEVDAKEDNVLLDVSTFEHLLAVARTVAVARPTNLFQFAHSPACHRALGLLRPGEDHVSDSSGGQNSVDGEVKEPVFIRYIMTAFWELLESQPINYSVLPVWHSGMRNVESVVTALVQILLCFISSDRSLAPCLTTHLVNMLITENTTVGFACRRAIVMALSPTVKRKASVPASSTPAAGRESASAASERTSGTPAMSSSLQRRQASETPPPSDNSGASGGSSASAIAGIGRGRGGSRRSGMRGRLHSILGGGDRAGHLLAALSSSNAGVLPAGLQDLSSIDAASLMEMLDDESVSLLPADGGSAGSGSGRSSGGRGSMAAQIDALLGGDSVQQEDINALADLVAEDDSMMEMALALSLQDGGADSSPAPGASNSASAASAGIGRGRSLLSSSSASRSLIQQALQTGNLDQLSQLAQVAGLDVHSFAQTLAQHSVSAEMNMEADSHASQDVEVGSLGSTAAMHQLVSDHGSSHAAEVASTAGDVLSLPESSQGVGNDVGSSDDDDDDDAEVSEVESIEGGQSAAGSHSASPAPAVAIATATTTGSASAGAVGDKPAAGKRFATSEQGHASSATGGTCELVETEDPANTVMCQRLHSMSLLLMHHLLKNIGQLDSLGGLRAIPYLQTLLMLCTRLDDVASPDNQTALQELLETCIGQLAMSEEEQERVSERTPRHEVKLVLLRLLSVLMSRTRPQGKSSANSAMMVCNVTAQTLVRHNTLDFCLLVLKGLLQHWNAQPSHKEGDVRASSTSSGTSPSGGSGGGSNSSSSSSGSTSLLQGHLSSAIPDMSPFFLKGYVKGHARDVFESFPQLLTEIVLRLAYLIKKILDPDCKDMKLFSSDWATCLAEYLLASQQVACVRKQVRSLLMLICGSKEKYRLRRDLHTVQSHISKVFHVCGMDMSTPGNVNDVRPISMPYNELLSLIEHLRACGDVATQRVSGWQTFCQQNEHMLLQLVQLSLRLVDGVVPQILLLLSCALTGKPSHAATQGEKSSKSSKSETSSGKICPALIDRFFGTTNTELLILFTRAFLLDTNSTPVRWQAHALLLALHKNGSPEQQAQLCNILWSLWSDLPRYGRKGAQFVDLLGYFVSCGQLSPEKAQQCSAMAVALLRQQNKIMSNHPNGHIYHMLSDMVDFDGYYLESDPCLVCNNPETPFTVVKLSSIRVDSKYTPTAQLVKLAGSYTIARLQLRINDSKRVKMVRTVNLYYNNRSVQSVVELKNKHQLWHHVKQIHLQAGQTEVKMDFPLPVVACNLMIEFADFFVNSQVNPETLQCPRCSAQVPTAPGVCSNCGENVYQCHKCRSINYDEKDPFLCTSCGFSKYAKFDFVLHARTCCAVDPIENEDDRKQAVTTINSLLDRADRSYRQLVSHRGLLEGLLGGAHVDSDSKESVPQERQRATQKQDQQPPSMRQHAHGVHPNIMAVSHKYSSECRSAFDELSMLIQKVLACRKELIEYDNAQQQLDGVDLSALSSDPDAHQHLPRSVASLVSAGGTHGNCYGCASAAVDHCITMLRAAAQSTEVRPMLISEGLIGELMESNLHLGTQQTRHHVKQLLCLLTRNNCRATHVMNKVLCGRVIGAIKSYKTLPNLAGAVRNEMDLLRMSVHMEDLCWEQRLRSVFKLFLASNCLHNPVVMDAVSRPCSTILLHVIKLTSKDQAPNQTRRAHGSLLHANAMEWLKRDGGSRNFTTWQRYCSTAKAKTEETVTAREHYLLVKYSQQWKLKARKASEWNAQVSRDTWLMRTLFCSSSRHARVTAQNMIEALCTDDDRRQHMLDLMMTSLSELSQAAQNGREFMTLFHELLRPLEWKLYLTVRGILPRLADLISMEIAKLQQLEETNLGSDLSQGTALKMLTEMLAEFLKYEPIKQRFKSRLVGAVLDGYLNLRRLIIQRTKMVDETQEMLLKLLEDMTSGTEEETKSFMAICVKTLSKYPMNDLRTPVIIFERLCSIVYPEENENTNFHLMLEKDPQQEEFLQGRMQGNPYSSSDPGLGPLMRDVKNKICRDCELVALLDDDASMELLVRNKIISLDLPVKEVYKKVWCDGADGAASEKVMRVVYRMTGLLGDATEEIVKTLGSGAGDGSDDEELFRMASVLCECAGLEAMLARLEHLPNLVRGQQMLHALLKLFGYALKLKANCQHLIDPSRRAVPILLATLNQALSLKQEFCSKVAEQVLSILETILQEASRSKSDMAALTAETSEVGVLLGFIESSFVRTHTPVLHGMMKVIPYLTFGHAESMCELIDHFVPHLNFDVFDEHQSAEDVLYMDCFCGIVQGIQPNEQGDRLKSLVLERSIVQHSIEHIQQHVPHYAASAGGTADKEWKTFLSKASVPYIMRLLTGLCKGHNPSQELVSAIIPALHHIEQTSSEGHVGSLAENVLEVLCEDAALKAKVKECRDHTRSEKKRRAMAMRQKQLKELGMNVNQHGQVVASVSAVEVEMAALVEESGLKCVICHEGYKNQPKKILGIYTFSKRCQLDDSEGRSRKNMGYYTVSHFNVVHYECHMSAVRLARIRDEWESAALQNSNTKCNGLMPIWGPSVSEASFGNCLARHNNNIQEFTGVREPSFSFVVHDIRMLLLRFVTERSFSDESGGGGRQSNIQFMPYIIQIALYIITTTRRQAHEVSQLASFLTADKSKWVSLCHSVESPAYYLVLALVLQTPKAWKACRLDILRRQILYAHARKDSTSPIQCLASSQPHDFQVYKPMLCLFAMVDRCQDLLKANVDVGEDEDFPQAWLLWMRHNDMAVLDSCDKVLRYLSENLKKCESLAEFCKEAGLLQDVDNPDEFLSSLLKSCAAQQ